MVAVATGGEALSQAAKTSMMELATVARVHLMRAFSRKSGAHAMAIFWACSGGYTLRDGEGLRKSR